jgi:hypothetical protein
MQANQVFSEQTEVRKSDLNKRLEDMGWALFLIMIGVIWLLPVGRVPEDAWLIGAGAIMLGINGVRYLKGIKISGFTLILGALALIAGLSGVFALKLPFFAVLFILIGASIILKPLLAKRE